MKGLTLGLACACLPANVYCQPKIMISTNQMNAYEAKNSSRLKADGTWLLAFNSPDVSFAQWKTVCSNIGTATFVSEDAGISSNYLFNAQMTPRISLRSSLGFAVNGRLFNNLPLLANVDPFLRTDREIFNLWYSSPTSADPVRLPITQLNRNGAEVCLTTYAGRWVSATGGGASTLVALETSPGPWERLRLIKKSAGDQYLRAGDKVGIQVWNGFWSGDNFVKLTGANSRLIATAPALAESESFRLEFPCEFITGSHIAPITHAMAYTEWADTQPSVRNWTLHNAEIDELAKRIGGPRVVVLTRTFEDYSELPGVLPTHREQIAGIADNPNLKGVVFEMTAGVDLGGGRFMEAVDLLCSRGKDVFFLIPPKDDSVNYASDVKKTLIQTKRSKWYSKITLVIGAYDRGLSKINFLGGSNSVEGALNWLKANR